MKISRFLSPTSFLLIFQSDVPRSLVLFPVRFLLLMSSFVFVASACVLVLLKPLSGKFYFQFRLGWNISPFARKVFSSTSQNSEENVVVIVNKRSSVTLLFFSRTTALRAEESGIMSCELKLKSG